MQNDPAVDDDPVLTNLKERKPKRAIEREAEREGEQQRPIAKSKAAQRQNKRTAGIISASVEQPASKRNNSASYQSCLQRVHVSLQSLAPQAQAVLCSLLRFISKVNRCINCCTSSSNLENTVVLSMMQRLSCRA